MTTLYQVPYAVARARLMRNARYREIALRWSGRACWFLTGTLVGQLATAIATRGWP